MATKDLRELRRGDVRHFPQLNRPPQNARKRSDPFIGYAARDDHFEVAEIGVDVQRKTVAGDPTRDSHADGTDLLIADPNPSQAGYSRSSDAELREGSNQHLFDVAHVAVNIAAVRLEVDDGIADKLSGPVIGHVAATACFVNFNCFGLELLLICEDVGAVGPAPEREYVWVLEEQQLFRALTGAKPLNCAFLKLEAVVVWNKAQPSSFA